MGNINDFKLDLVYFFDKYLISTKKDNPSERSAKQLIKIIELREEYLKNNKNENEI